MSNFKNSPENLTAISTFVCVGESASLTAAAHKLQISVSGVSKAISRLEDRLRVRLVNRTSRSISLTDEGAVYFERCRQILTDLEEAEARITGSQSEPRGRLRLQMPRALGKKIVLPALTSLLDSYPELVLDVTLDTRPLNIEEEGIDIALRYGIEQGSLLVAKRLARVFYVACCAPSYVRRHGEPSTPPDLFGHRCINYITSADGRYRRWNFLERKTVVSLTFPSVLNVNDMEALTEAAIQGAGIAYLPDFMVADHVAAGSLKVLLPAYMYEGDSVVMVYPRRRFPSSRSRVVRDFLSKLLPEHPPWSETVSRPRAKEAERLAVSKSSGASEQFDPYARIGG